MWFLGEHWHELVRLEVRLPHRTLCFKDKCHFSFPIKILLARWLLLHQGLSRSDTLFIFPSLLPSFFTSGHFPIPALSPLCSVWTLLSWGNPCGALYPGNLLKQCLPLRHGWAPLLNRNWAGLCGWVKGLTFLVWLETREGRKYTCWCNHTNPCPTDFHLVRCCWWMNTKELSYSFTYDSFPCFEESAHPARIHLWDV